MRIAFEATALLDTPTGVGAFVRETLVRLAARDDLDITAFGFTRIYLDELAAALPPNVVGTKHPIPARTTRLAWLVANRPAIERWTGPIDVVHGPNFVVPPARAAVKLVTVHDLTSVRFPEMCDANTAQYPRLIRRALRRGAHVHAVSQSVADEIVDAFTVDRARVHVVPNGFTTPAGGDAARGRAAAGGDRYVLAVGTIEPRKNLAGLVTAFDVVANDDADVRLVLAGGPGWGAHQVDEAVDAARNRARIVRLGRVDDATRADLLAGAVALAYPSRYEGFGLPPLEAMSVGVPVLTTRVGAIPEVVGDAALLVEPEADDLAAGLARILTDDALRADLITRGRERVTHYSWDACAAGLAALYHSLAD